MQRKDIKTGTLLAKGNADGDYFAPVFVLDTSTLWKRTTSYGAKGATWEPTSVTRAGRHSHGYVRTTTARWGLLAVVGASTSIDGRHMEHAETVRRWLAGVEDPHTLTPDTVAALAVSTPKGVEVTIIEPRDLIGEWDRALADAERRDRRERERIAEIQRERERLEAVAARVNKVWCERVGEEVPFSYNVYDDIARLPIDRLAALLGVADD